MLVTACGLLGAQAWPGVSRATPVGGRPAASVQTITAGGVSVPAITVDPVTHLLWAAVATQGSADYVEKISEATLAVVQKIRVRAGVDTIAVDPKAGLVWVGSGKSQVVTEITESTGSVRTVDLTSVGTSAGISALAVDPGTGKVFVLTTGNYLASIAEQARTWRILAAMTMSASLTVDPSARQIWISDGASQVTGFTESGTPLDSGLAVGTTPFALAADPAAGTVWVASEGSNAVNAVDEVTSAVAGPVQVGRAPVAVTADPAAGLVWVANFADGSISQVSEASGTVTGTLSAGAVRYPLSLAIDTGNGRVYAGGYTSGFVGAITAFRPAVPAFTSAPSAWFATSNIAEDSVTLTTSGFPAPAFAITSPNPPGWLTVDPVTGVLAGTPPGPAGDAVTITVTASNGVGSASQAVTIRMGTDPVFTSPARATFTAGVTGSFRFRAPATPAATFRLVGGTLPRGLRLSRAGVLSGAPAPAAAGTRRLRIAAVNPLHRSVQAFTLIVRRTPQGAYAAIAPAAVPGVTAAGAVASDERRAPA